MSYRNHLYSRELRVDLQGNGDFTSIKAACDHAATISPRNSSNYVLIHVNAGDYTENDFTVPSYTALVGAGQGGETTLPSTFIGPSNTSASGARSAFVTLGQYAVLSDVVVSFWTGTASGLGQDFGTVKTTDDAWIENCRITFAPTYSGANNVCAVLGTGLANDTLNIHRSTISIGGGTSSINVKSSQRVGCYYSQITGSGNTSLYITSNDVSTIAFTRLESQVLDIYADTGTVNILSTKVPLNMRSGSATFVDMHPTPQQLETAVRAKTTSVSASYTIDAYDDGTVACDLGGSVITMPPVSDCVPGQAFVVENKSQGSIIVDANDTVFAAGSALNDDLIAHWKMDEAGGSTRNDSVGQNHLTDNNTVGARTGLLNDAADFIAGNDEYLSIADNPDISMDGTDFAWSMWVYTDSLSATGNWLLNKRDAVAKDEFQIAHITGDGKVYAYVFNGGNPAVFTSVISTVVPGTGSWFHVYAEWDDTAKNIGISVNNETLVTANAPGYSIISSDADLGFGAAVWSPTTAAFHHDGAIDNVSFWKRKLTAAERDDVYNEGAPKNFLRPTALTNKMIAYWPMNEPSGVRADIIGGNDLTDNNTVGTRAGLLNPAADFIAANDEYFSILDNPDISHGGTDFAWSMWAKVDVLPVGSNGAYLVEKRNDPANAEFQIDIPTATGLPRIIVFKNGQTSTNMSAVSTIDVSGGDWFHVYAEYDSSTGTVGISVNDESLVTTTDGTWAISDTSSTLQFGGYAGLASNRHDGAISDVTFWKRKLTTAERTLIYNSGLPLYNMLTSETRLILPGIDAAVTLQLNSDNEWVLVSDNRYTVKASWNDLYPSYLYDKLSGETGKITLSVVNDGEDERVNIDIGADVFDKTVDDATDITYTPTDGADWIDPDPVEVGEALDDLADRVANGVLTDELVSVSANDTTPDYLVNKVTGTAGSIVVTEVGDGGDEDLNINVGTNIFNKTTDDAADVSYTPTTGTDWPDPDPTEVEGALDNLASRVTNLASLVGHSWSMTTPTGSSGDFYLAGYYDFAGTPNDFSPSITWGTANSSYAAHFFVVLGATPSDTITITITGTSINDSGTRTTTDTENIVLTTGESTNDFFETTKKWIGQVTVEAVSGTPISCNYGWCKYWDNNNTDFTVKGLEATWYGGATDAGADILLIHHKATGWTYNAGAAPTPPTEIASLDGDHSTESSVINNEHGAWKRANLSTAIDGDGSEGIIVQVTTTASNAFRLGNFSLMIQTTV